MIVTDQLFGSMGLRARQHDTVFKPFLNYYNKYLFKICSQQERLRSWTSSVSYCNLWSMHL